MPGPVGWSIGCEHNKRGKACNHWACYNCSGFETEVERIGFKGKWLCSDHGLITYCYNLSHALYKDEWLARSFASLVHRMRSQRREWHRVQQLGMRGLLGQANGIRGRMVLQVPSGVNVARLNRDFVIFRRLWRNPRRWRQRKRRRRRRSRIRSWRTRRWTARRRTLSVTSK